MIKENEAARDLWAQIFGRAAQLPNATMNDPDYQSDDDWIASAAVALREAGWNDDEIARRLEDARTRMLEPNLNSPGVGPGLEGRLRGLADRIKRVLESQGKTAHRTIEVAIDPIAGISAALTNVIMTDETILTVSSFLFRWCGLIARAYTRTLHRDIQYWNSPHAIESDKSFLQRHPDLGLYWARIMLSFAGTGTHAFVPYKPSKRHEIILMEQVAWAMEYFTVAHEFGHHMLNHRSIDADPIEQEYRADAFALQICEILKLEPFVAIENPYLLTGAGATLMLTSLNVLRSLTTNNATTATHPPIEKRIARIMQRHLLQPQQLKIDRAFNGTVIRVMSSVEAFMPFFLERGGQKLLGTLRALS